MIEHVHAIQNLKARYCAATDLSAGDPAQALALLTDMFLPDAVGDYGSGPLVGREAVLGFLCTVIAANSEWLIHMLHSPIIECDGETAQGDWTVMVHLKRRGGEAVDVVIGRYSDRFRLTPDGWKIERVGFRQPG